MGATEIIYLSGFILATIIRKHFTAKFKPEKEQIKQGSALEKVFLGLMGVAMLLPLVSIWVDLFPFADYESIVTLEWLGLVIFFCGIYVLYRSHSDLASNWNPEVAINEDQKLVQIGIYKRIRHPMYSAHILWALANAMIFPNWIIGPCMLVVAIPFLSIRIPKEEKLLSNQFPDYMDYKARTRML
jgi:protein-S-isoprenylcysteine O-methyltransferase Ste14